MLKYFLDLLLVDGDLRFNFFKLLENNFFKHFPGFGVKRMNDVLILTVGSLFAGHSDKEVVAAL